MYSKIDEYKEVLKSDEQQYDAYIILQDGTKIDSDISGLKSIFNLGEKIIGNFATKRVEFSLFNTSKYNITNQEFEVFVGLKVNNEFNYISLGKYIANKPEIKDETQDECFISAQNYSLKFKIPYEPILVFPCTIKEAIKKICEYLNIVYVENEFINANYVLQEFFIEEDATFFDVIKILVEAGFANANIDNTNSLIVKSPQKIVDYTFSLNELFEMKKEDNKFGPLNSIVASRIVFEDGNTTEDIYSKNEESVVKNGLYEYKIKQNDAIDYDRQTAVNNMLAGILNFEYIPATIEAVYNPATELSDMLEVPDKNTDTSFLLFVKEITADISSGLMTIESTEETRTETDYKSATNKDKNRKTELKVNKLEGEIKQVISQVDGQNQKISETLQKVDEITSKISDIADITVSKESTNAVLEFEDINQSEPISIKIYPRGNNISYLYPHDNLYPSDDLFMTTRTLRFTNTTTEEIFDYELPDDLLIYDNENYDEFVFSYDSLSVMINKKCCYNADGTVALLDTPKTINYDFTKIELTDGNYKVELLGYSNAYMFVRLMAQNIYTTQFATKAELNSEIKQTEDEINVGVNKKLENYSTTDEMNSAINIKANQITSSVQQNYTSKGELNTAKSEFRQTTEDISSEVSKKVGNDEIISKINQSAESVNIDANRININRSYICKWKF